MDTILFTEEKIFYRNLPCLVIEGINPKAKAKDLIKLSTPHKAIIKPMYSNIDIGEGAGIEIEIKSNDWNVRKKGIGLDPELEGFSFQYHEKGNPNVAYIKHYPEGIKKISNRFDYYMYITYNERNNWVTISHGFIDDNICDWDTVFAGQIHKQDDLKMVLKMVTVND